MSAQSGLIGGSIEDLTESGTLGPSLLLVADPADEAHGDQQTDQAEHPAEQGDQLEERYPCLRAAEWRLNARE